LTALLAPLRGNTPLGTNTLAPLVGLFLAGFLAFGIGVYAFTQFLGPVQAEFGWSRATLGGLMSAFWAAAPSVLLAAYAVDRIGIRWVIGTGVVIEAIGIVCIAGVSEPKQFLAVRLAMGIGKCLMVTPIPIATARWFRVRTGLAYGLVLSGWHVGGLVLAPLASTWIAAVGWRAASLRLAALMLCGGLLTLLLIRPPAPVSAGLAVARVRDAYARPWVLALIGTITVVYYAGYATFLSQLSVILRDVGLTPRVVGSLTGSVALCASLGTVAAGVVTQRIRPFATVGALLVAAGVLEWGTCTLHAGASVATVLLILLPFGLVIGGGDPVLIEALRCCTPLARYNRCYGWWYLACLAGLAVAPVAAGAVFDHFGSYDRIFIGLASGTACLGGLWLATTRSTDPESVQDEDRPIAPEVEPRFGTAAQKGGR